MKILEKKITVPPLPGNPSQDWKRQSYSKYSPSAMRICFCAEIVREAGSQAEGSGSPHTPFELESAS